MSRRQESLSRIPRDRESGVALLVTLVGLVVLVGFAQLVAARINQEAVIVHRVLRSFDEEQKIASVHELLRPKIFAAMIGFEQNDVWRLNGAPIVLEYGGSSFLVEVQDVEGLAHVFKTSDRELRRLLPKALLLAVLAERDSADVQSFELLNMTVPKGEDGETYNPRKWLTTISKHGSVDASTAHWRYLAVSEVNSVSRQPKRVLVDVKLEEF